MHFLSCYSEENMYVIIFVTYVGFVLIGQGRKNGSTYLMGLMKKQVISLDRILLFPKSF